MSILRRIISSTTVRVLALLSIGLTAHADEHDRNEHGRKMVFAHYMVTNQDYQGDTDPHQEAKIAAYEKEIQQAQSAGIDGFALNVGGWLNQTYYIRYSAQIFEAANSQRATTQATHRWPTSMVR
jgi:glucan endo-1,3-alpha-glucosidase